jgi:hypothetical protein
MLVFLIGVGVIELRYVCGGDGECEMGWRWEWGRTICHFEVLLLFLLLLLLSDCGIWKLEVYSVLSSEVFEWYFFLQVSG